MIQLPIANNYEMLFYEAIPFTLPIVFNRDLSLIQDPLKLQSSKDLAEITELAQDRKCWRGLTSRIEKAAEV